MSGKLIEKPRARNVGDWHPVNLCVPTSFSGMTVVPTTMTTTTQTGALWPAMPLTTTGWTPGQLNVISASRGTGKTFWSGLHDEWTSSVPLRGVKATLGPLQYQEVWQEERQKGYRPQKLPHERDVKMIRKIILPDLYRRKLNNVDYKVYSDKEHGAVIEFGQHDAEQVAVNLFGMVHSHFLKVPGYWEGGQSGLRKKIEKWLEENMPEVWPFLYHTPQSDLVRLRFSSKNDLIKFRLYFTE